MILSRSLTLLLCTILNHMVAISPNKNNEMGTADGDKPLEGGRPRHIDTIKMVLTGILLIPLFYNVYYYYEYPFTSIETYTVMILIAAASFRFWCFWELGNLFTFGLGIRKDHKLIKSGPYKYLVHPSYTGQLLTHYCYWGILLLGHGVIFFNVLFVLLVGYSLFMVRKRIVLEEKMMGKNFGDEYWIYISERKRLIPFIF